MPHQDASGYPDVDYVPDDEGAGPDDPDAQALILPTLPDEHLRSIRWVQSTGAGVIFGATGGVMEAALRTAVETLDR